MRHDEKVLVEKGIKKKIIIFPLGNIDKKLAENTFKELKKFIPDIQMFSAVKLPSTAYYKSRNRYRADSLIHWMNKIAKSNEVYVGITHVDISTTKNGHADWGVMGLSYMPGSACVVSTHRIKNKAFFYKVVIHEIGHCMGLPHCNVKTCFMRDANGDDTTAEEKEFCETCNKKIFSKQL